MADIERLIIWKALSTGELPHLISRGIEVDHFVDEDVQDVYEYSLKFLRDHKQPPSITAVKEQFPKFNAKLSSDPLDYHIKKFTRKVKERKAIELVRAYHEALEDPDEIDEIELRAMEMARELIAVVPAPRASRLSEGQSRKREYDRRKKEGIQHGTMMGIPSFDEIMLGIQPHELVVVGGYMGRGKAQPLDSGVLTPDGWTTMGELLVDDDIVGSDGEKQKVTGIFDQGVKDNYVVEFNDGSTTECCGEHLWTVFDSSARIYRTKTLNELRNSVLKSGTIHRWHVDNIKPVKFNKSELPIDSYLLGLLLGDGGLTGTTPVFSSADPEIIESISQLLPDGMLVNYSDQYDYRLVDPKAHCKNPNRLTKDLRDLGLMGKYSYQKYIPDEYLFSSLEDRIGLLQGILDADGSAAATRVDYSSSSEQLALDVCELVESLGGRTNLSVKKTTHLDSYRVCIRMSSEVCPFRLQRKRLKYKLRTKYADMRRAIVGIYYVGKTTMRCISVSNQDNLYVTDNYILTHNTTLMQFFALNAYLQGKTVLFVSLEVEAEQILRKFDVMLSNVRYRALKALELDAGEEKAWTAILEKCESDKAERDIIVRDDIQNCTTDKIAAEVIREKPSFLCVDYLEEMTAPRGIMGWEAVSRNGRDLKQHARVKKIPTVTATQLNREGGKGEVTLSTLGYQSIGKQADTLLGMSQDDDQAAQYEMDVLLLKHRDGPSNKTATMDWKLDTMQIKEKGSVESFPLRASKRRLSKKDREKEQKLQLAQTTKDKPNPFAAKAKKKQPKGLGVIKSKKAI